MTSYSRRPSTRRIREGAPNPDPVAVANIGTDGVILVVEQESFRAAVISPRKAVAVVLQAVADVLPYTSFVGGVCYLRYGRGVDGVGDGVGICGVEDWGG